MLNKTPLIQLEAALGFVPGRFDHWSIEEFAKEAHRLRQEAGYAE